MSLPILRTPRLTLRPYCLDDIDALHQLWTTPEVRRYLWDDIVITRERAEETVRAAMDTAEREGFGHWVITDDASALVGFCGLTRREPDLSRRSRETAKAEEDIELLYGLAPECWGRGLATEASRAVLRFAFETLGAARIIALTDTPNCASARVMERLGMRFTHRGTLNGLDTVFYELRREDFRNHEMHEIHESHEIPQPKEVS